MKKPHIELDVWYRKLQTLSKFHRTRVGEIYAWRDDYDASMTPEEAFYGEFSEFQPEKEQ